MYYESKLNDFVLPPLFKEDLENISGEIISSAKAELEVDGETIVKIGETGNPLGIRTSRTDQPLKGTKCRFGRLISHRNDVTDQSIRDTLEESVNA